MTKILKQESEEGQGIDPSIFKLLAEYLPDALVVVNATSEVVFVNNQAEKLFSYKREELLGKPLEMLMPERFHKIHIEHREHYFSNPWARPMGLGLELVCIRKDGSEFFCDISLSPIETKYGLLVASSIRDITSNRERLCALENCEEQIKKFFEETLTGNFIANPNGKLVNCNTIFAYIFGFDSQEEAIEKCDLSSLYYTKGIKAEETFIELLQKEKKLELYEFKLRKQDGRLVYLLGNVIGVFDKGDKLIEIRGYFLDNTELKMLEEQFRHSQKMEAIGRLAGGVAHDFNNLLTTIMGHTEFILNETRKSNPFHDNLTEIKKASEQAASLTKQLLIFSRKQVLQPKILDLNLLIANIHKLLKRLIGEDIELVLSLDPESGYVKTDPGQLEQVIVNLAVNARDAMPDGGVLTIETSNIELDEAYTSHHVGLQPGHYIMFAVSDTGIGIDEESKPHIFEPFFTTKSLGKGTGLGLSTVYGIVKQSGGNIWVYSEPKHGTTFKIYLPRAEGIPDSQEKDDSITMPQHNKETVMLVEDEDGVRSLIQKILKRNGYTVLSASCGEEAIRIYKQYNKGIDLIITDAVMPHISGSRLVEELRAIRPEIRVLFMSGYTDDAIIQHGVLGKDTVFLEKPFTTNALLQKINEALKAIPTTPPL